MPLGVCVLLQKCVLVFCVQKEDREMEWERICVRETQANWEGRWIVFFEFNNCYEGMWLALTRAGLLSFLFLVLNFCFYPSFCSLWPSPFVCPPSICRLTSMQCLYNIILTPYNLPTIPFIIFPSKLDMFLLLKHQIVCASVSLPCLCSCLHIVKSRIFWVSSSVFK